MPPPSHRDLMKALGWKSPASARHQIAQLVAKGYLRMEEGKARSALLPRDRARQTGSVPLVDRFDESGAPAKIATYMPLPVQLFPGDPAIGFLTLDNKMKSHGILEGDVVIVRADLMPKPGDLVAVVKDAKAHVVPANQAKTSTFAVVGVVRLVIRAYGADAW